MHSFPISLGQAFAISPISRVVFNIKRDDAA